MRTALRPAAEQAGVCRHALLARMHAVSDKPLLLLLAPPGAGKTTLLQQWLATAWPKPRVLLALTPYDDQPLRFFRRLHAALRQQLGDSTGTWFDPLAADLHEAPVTLALALFEDLNRLPSGVCLVLDDAQCLQDPYLVAVLRVLAELASANVQLVLASRQALPWLPACGLLDGRIACLQGADFAFTDTEIQALGAYLGAAVLQPPALQAVQAMTQGWATGVKVALLSHARFGLPALAQFNGSQPQIVEYFGDVVLRQLSAERRDFFLVTALLETFDGALCDAVLQRRHSGVLLEQLAAQHLFIQPLAERHGWYRYHPLLQDYLLHRVQLEQADNLPALQRRAACHLARHGQTDFHDDERALQHAQASGDHALHWRMLLQTSDAWLKAGYFSRVLKHLMALDTATLLAQPSLLGALVEALVLSRCFTQADHYLHLAEQHGLAQGDDGAGWLLLRLLLGTFRDDAASSLPKVAQGLRATQVPMALRAQAQTLLAYHEMMAGELSAAIDYASQAQALLAHSGHHFLQSYADLIVVLSRRHAGQSLAARNQVYADFSACPRTSPAWLNRATAMLVTLYEQNQLAEAQALGEELITEITASSASEAIVTVYVTLSRVLYCRGLPERAARLLENLTRAVELGHYPRLFGHVAQEALRQALLSGSSSVLEGVARRFQLPQRWAAGEWECAGPYCEGWERSAMACVYWLIGTAQHAQAARLLKVLAHALQGSQMRVRRLTVHINLLCLNPEQDSQSQQAQTLKSLIAEYGIACFSRGVLDEAPGATRLLQQAVQQGVLPVPDKYRQHYATFIGQTVAPLRLSQLAELTDKEREIVDGALQGLSNAQLSDKLGIAVSTTKWHLKNIYAKLGVRSRTELLVNVGGVN